ncbi:uncharacterized protein [Anoplolepis gracilipes]|uniref:uncharacterized protein isoform X2 n=1 Tax=Anoplolepis gracilipes TaxID=354296 RepID=UPI003BA0ADDE
MQRVLSFQMTRNIGESSEYVTKRLCFSFLFSVGFVCLLCGFLLGRFTSEMSIKTQAQKIRDKLAGNGLQATEHLQQMALTELTKTSLDITNWPMLYSERYINEVFSNLSFIHEVENDTLFIHATVHGSREPDRYIILSVNGDGIAVALELAEVLDRIYSAHDWLPQRSLIFCISLTSTDICPQILPTFMLEKVVAYIAVHGRFTQANNRVTLIGSDVIRSIAVEAIKTIPNGNWTYLENEVFGPRLSLNVPQVIFSFDDSNSTNSQTHHNQNLESRSLILAQMVSQTIWRLSESIVIQWEPKYFNETVNEVLIESIDSSRFYLLINLKKRLDVLLAAVEDFNAKLDTMDITQMLPVRIWNDLFLDLDKALLCFDGKLQYSRTDLTIFRKELLNYQSIESIRNTVDYLREIKSCYLDAIEVLQKSFKKDINF